MTRDKLIELLQSLPADAEVTVSDGQGFFPCALQVDQWTLAFDADQECFHDYAALHPNHPKRTVYVLT